MSRRVKGRHIAGSLDNQWEVAIEVYDRWRAYWPGFRAGVWNDPVEGPVWVDARSTVIVEVRAFDWYGHFHRREPAPDQTELGL
jgi:hypothetical protein